MFKMTYEKTGIAYQLPEGMVEAMLCLVYPDKKLILHHKKCVQNYFWILFY